MYMLLLWIILAHVCASLEEDSCTDLKSLTPEFESLHWTNHRITYKFVIDYWTKYRSPHTSIMTNQHSIPWPNQPNQYCQIHIIMRDTSSTDNNKHNIIDQTSSKSHTTKPYHVYTTFTKYIHVCTHFPFLTPM